MREPGTRMANARNNPAGEGAVHTLVCIELPGQIGRALKSVRRRGLTSFSLLALTPHVEYALEKLGQPYKRPEDYHSEQDIHQVGLDDLRVLDRFRETVDGFLSERWELLGQHGIRPARLNWYYLKLLFNSVSIRAFITARILSAERPGLVLYFGTRTEAVQRELFFVRESAWSRVIAAACNSMDFPCEALGSNNDPSVLNRWRGVQRKGLRGTSIKLARKILGPSFLRRLRSGYISMNRGGRKLVPSLSRHGFSPRPGLLTLERSHSLEHLLSQVHRRGKFNVFHWEGHKSWPSGHLNGAKAPNVTLPQGSMPPRTALAEQATELWKEVRALPELAELFHPYGVDCFPIIERRLRRFFAVDLPILLETVLRARAFLSSQRPIAVLASTMGDPQRHAMALAAKKEGIPFVVYRHGACVSFAEMKQWLAPVIEHNDLRTADYVLAFGRGDRDYMETVDGDRAEIVAVGSAHLDHLKKPVHPSTRQRLLRGYGLDPGKSTVMYVPTVMDGNIRSAPYRARSPATMFEMERRIVEAFGEFPNIQFVVKLPSSAFNPTSPIAQWIKDQNLRNCVVITDPFSHLLAMADMFVLDLPSTAFLEALTTDKPILYTGHESPLPWEPLEQHPNILGMWKERIAYADDLEVFLELLRTYLTEERFQPVESENTLLKQYGTHLDDGRSAERAHQFLESLAAQIMGQPTGNPTRQEYALSLPE